MTTNNLIFPFLQSLVCILGWYWPASVITDNKIFSFQRLLLSTGEEVRSGLNVFILRTKMTFRHLTTETLFDLCSEVFVLTMLSSIFHRAVQTGQLENLSTLLKNLSFTSNVWNKNTYLLLQNKSNHNNDKVDFVVSQIDKEAAISGFITTISVISLVLPVLVKPCQLSESDQVKQILNKQSWFYQILYLLPQVSDDSD